MGAKVAAFLITLVLMVILAVVGFVVLIIALNGYNESDATYSFGAYAIFAFLLVFAFACVAGGVTHLLLAKEFAGKSAAMIGILIGVVVGFIGLFICIVIGILIAEYFRAYG